MKLQFYVLVHEHEYGQSLYGFYFEPTRELPYPSVLRVVKKFAVNYEPQFGESVSLHTVEGAEPDLVLQADEVGSHSQSCWTLANSQVSSDDTWDFDEPCAY